MSIFVARCPWLSGERFGGRADQSYDPLKREAAAVPVGLQTVGHSYHSANRVPAPLSAVSETFSFAPRPLAAQQNLASFPGHPRFCILQVFKNLSCRRLGNEARKGFGNQDTRTLHYTTVYIMYMVYVHVVCKCSRCPGNSIVALFHSLQWGFLPHDGTISTFPVVTKICQHFSMVSHWLP